MKVLLVGSGGREHALAWKLSRSKSVYRLLAAPGNPGIGALARNLPNTAAEDVPGVVRAALDHRVDLVVVGPEAPLEAGLADELSAAGIKVFGPTASAARIESSKAWAKDLMRRHGIPTAEHKTFHSAAPAHRYIRSMPEGAAVIKADGLAGGKGVVLPTTKGEAERAVSSMMGGAFGKAGSTVVVEERLSGVEVSVFAFVDGTKVSAEVAACDYKRVYDGDRGPNTGGMGAYSPPEFWTDDLAGLVRRQILEPTARAMVAEGCPYQGVIYAGLMVTLEGPKVIEFNCRFGDPETQVVLPRLATDLVDVCAATAEGRLEDVEVVWDGRAHVAVVMASGGYPGRYATGDPITGLESAAASALVFHAGTASTPEGGIVTSGGRVLAVTGSGADLSEARARAYDSVRAIKFDRAHYRTDVAGRAVGAPV